MHKLPYIESERLILRLLNVGEHSQAAEYWRVNKDHLAPFGPKLADDYYTDEFWLKQVERNLKEFEADFSARMFLFERGAPVPVGHVSLAAILRGAAQFCYLGYGLALAVQGKGYMTEILPLCVKYGFEELQLHRIMANYVPTNDRSGRLLKRVGFTVEGYARDYLHLNGRWEDHIMTAITNPNWTPPVQNQ